MLIISYYCWYAIIILTLQKLLQLNCFGSATTCLANCDFSLELPVNFTFARISGFLPRLPQTIARSIAEIAQGAENAENAAKFDERWLRVKVQFGFFSMFYCSRFYSNTTVGGVFSEGALFCTLLLRSYHHHHHLDHINMMMLMMMLRT